MAEKGNSIGDFFINLLFHVDGKSEHEAHEAVEGIKEKIAEIAKEAFAFNEIREAIKEGLVEPLHEAWEGVAKVAEMGHHLETFSETMGVAVEDLQRFAFFGQSVGVSAETMQHSMLMLSRQMGEAASGASKEAAEGFAKLGVSIRGAGGEIRNVGEVMPELLEKFSQLHTPAERAKLAMDVFGRSGMELLPLLSQESEKLAQLKEDFEALGGAFSEELLERSHEFVSAQEKAAFSFGNMKRELATGLMPTLTAFINIWLDFARSSWPEISHVLKSIGETLGHVFMSTAGTAFDTFLKGAKMIYHSVDWDALKEKLLIVGAALAALFAIMNPGIAIASAVAVAIEDVFAAMAGKDSLIGRITVAIRDWWGELKQAYPWVQKIADAIHAMKLGFDVMEKFFSSDSKTLGNWNGSMQSVIEEEKERRATPGFFDKLDAQQRQINAIKSSNMSQSDKNAALKNIISDRALENEELPELVPVHAGGGRTISRGRGGHRIINNHTTVNINGGYDPKAHAREFEGVARRIQDTQNAEAFSDVATEGT